MKNLDKMDEFLNAFYLPPSNNKYKQSKPSNMQQDWSSKQQTASQQRKQELDGFGVRAYDAVKEMLISGFLTLFQKLERAGTLHTHCLSTILA